MSFVTHIVKTDEKKVKNSKFKQEIKNSWSESNVWEKRASEMFPLAVNLITGPLGLKETT